MSSGARPQRRHLDRQDVQTEEQIGAEPMLGDFLLEIPIRGGDHAHVDADVVRSAHALEALFLEESQQLGLKPGSHLADLVEEDRAAVGHFEKALLLQTRVGERAALVAEQLALEQLLGKRRARDVHERLGGPVARVVDDLGDQVLARAAFTSQQDRRRRAARDAGHQMTQGSDRRGIADQALQAVGPRGARAVLPNLAPKPGRLQRAFDRRR